MEYIEYDAVIGLQYNQFIWPLKYKYLQFLRPYVVISP